MSGTMIQGQTTDELGLRGRPMLHLHDLNHVKIGLGRGLVYGQNGIHDVRSELLGERVVELGRKRGAGDAEEELAVNLPV